MCYHRRFATGVRLLPRGGFLGQPKECYRKFKYATRGYFSHITTALPFANERAVIHGYRLSRSAIY
jgi:hypothetical protein